MPEQFVTIIDRDRNIVATAEVEFRGGCFTGPINLGPMPIPLRSTFEEYESILNDQVFSLLDQIEDRIAATALRVIFQDGCEESVDDLQILPVGGRVSFRRIATAVPIDGTCLLKHLSLDEGRDDREAWSRLARKSREQWAQENPYG